MSKPGGIQRDPVQTNLQWMTMAMLVTRATNLFFYLFLARWIGVEPFGTFVFALAFAAAFAVIPDWGLHELTVREVAQDRRVAQQYLTNGLAFKVLLVILAVAGMAGTVHLLGYPSATQKAVFLASGYFLAQSFESLFFSIFRAFEKVKYEAILTTVRDLSLPVVGILLLVNGAGIMEILMAYALLGLASCLVTASVTLTRFVPVSSRVLDIRFMAKKLGLTALSFALGNVFLILYAKHGILILQYLRGGTEVGWYGAADKVIDAALIIPYIATAGLYPAFSRLAVTSRTQLEQSVSSACKGLVIVGLLTAVCTSFIVAQPLVSLLYGRSYLPATWVLQCLIWTLPFFFLARVIFVFWAAIGKQSLVNAGLGFAILLGIIGNLLVVPHFGMNGVAVTSLATISLLCFLSLVVLSRQVRLQSLAHSTGGIIASAILASVTAIALRYLGTPWGITLALTIILFAVVLWACGVFSNEEKQRWQAMFQQILHKAVSLRILGVS